MSYDLQYIHPIETMPEQDSSLEQQMSTTLMTEPDVVAAFKLFLNRQPLPSEDLSPLLNSKPEEFLRWMMNTPEFLSRTGTDALVLNITKRIQDFQKSNPSQTS